MFGLKELVVSVCEFCEKEQPIHFVYIYIYIDRHCAGNRYIYIYIFKLSGNCGVRHVNKLLGPARFRPSWSDFLYSSQKSSCLLQALWACLRNLKKKRTTHASSQLCATNVLNSINSFMQYVQVTVRISSTLITHSENIEYIIHRGFRLNWNCVRNFSGPDVL